MTATEYIEVIHRDLLFPTFDSDNHLYENQDALTKFLPDEYKGVIRYVDVGGRTKLAILRPCIASHKQQERPATQHSERHPDGTAAGQVPQANAFQMVLHRGILTK